MTTKKTNKYTRSTNLENTLGLVLSVVATKNKGYGAYLASFFGAMQHGYIHRQQFVRCSKIQNNHIYHISYSMSEFNRKKKHKRSLQILNEGKDFQN